MNGAIIRCNSRFADWPAVQMLTQTPSKPIIVEDDSLPYGVVIFEHDGLTVTVDFNQSNMETA